LEVDVHNEMNRQSTVWKGAVAGIAAGLIGSWAMTRFQVAVSGRGLTGSENPQSNKPVDGRDDATMKAADLTAQATIGRPLKRWEKTEIGGPAAHYAFGAAAGALYGITREAAPGSSLSRGGPFGAALWIAADQVGLPMTGLSPQPLSAFPLSTNLQHLVAHLVYGITTSLSYAAIRKSL
jgi:hypothetical protein